jgi:uncharacterized protein YegJ (DUF2314 family)
LNQKLKEGCVGTQLTGSISYTLVTMQKSKQSIIDNVNKKIFFMGKFLGRARDVFKYEYFAKENNMEDKEVEEVKCSPITLKNLYLILFLRNNLYLILTNVG